MGNVFLVDNLFDGGIVIVGTVLLHQLLRCRELRGAIGNCWLARHGDTNWTKGGGGVETGDETGRFVPGLEKPNSQPSLDKKAETPATSSFFVDTYMQVERLEG